MRDPGSGPAPPPDSWKIVLDKKCDSYIVKAASNATIFQFDGIRTDNNMGAAISVDGEKGNVGLKITTKKP